MLRRHFLATLTAAPLITAASPRLDRSRISFISDEGLDTPAEAIDFAKKYGLQWMELRDVPGRRGHYMRQSDDVLKETAQQLRDNGIRVSFLNTPMFKATLPGSEPVLRNPETPEQREKRIARGQAEFDRRKQDFEQAFRAAHLLGVDKIRCFTFLRTAEPEKTYQQIADIIGEMAELAAKAGIKILMENEQPCNVVTCAEIGAFMKLLPRKNVGVNWDPLNGMSRKEVQFPDGYNLLPKERVWNVQLKGHTLLDPAQKLPWGEIFKALARDGYQGQAGLETHYFDGTNREKSHASMAEILRHLEA
ncbi:MAG TPA: sugar phosphate isomerase/epimerase family protein [Bryobacteraceae bacterium]|nr:sugar phosphate isomerase/epimerase family protein [Bryobacteraceae bacterium]